MATYYVVDKNTDPLGPNELRAGETLDVNSGDVFVISASAADDIKFESATGKPTSFEIRFETSNSNDFDIEIEDDLDVAIAISSDVDLSDIDIEADEALSVVLTAEDNVSLGKFEGSSDGVDSLTIGDGFSTDEDIKLNGGDNFLKIGDNATIRKIETGAGKDTINLGDNLSADEIKTGGGADALSIGDDGFLDKIETGSGNDTVSVGDNFTADKLETKEGDDLVISGRNGSIDELKGGKGNDQLKSATKYSNAREFENICFAHGTHIETDKGQVPIETLRVGDRIKTMDHGFQAIRWIGSTTVPGLRLHAPIRIAAGALGNTRPLWVSQQHRMLVSGAGVQFHFGEAEVLVAAKYLAAMPGIDLIEVPQIEYFHMLFDRHEIVFAEGIPSESFYPGSVGMGTFSNAVCAEIYSLFPELETNASSFGNAARYVLKSYEASLLAA
ncbi:MAG: Hint domain-containing protein [Sulfitobacter sp.]